MIIAVFEVHHFFNRRSRKRSFRSTARQLDFPNINRVSYKQGISLIFGRLSVSINLYLHRLVDKYDLEINKLK